jgi:tight adherence protein C
LTLGLTYESPSLLEKRFKKTTAKQSGFIIDTINYLNEKMKPFSKKNVSTSNYMSKSKKLLLQAGYASSEDDVIKYDAKKLSNMLLVGIIMLVLIILSFSVNTIVISILALYLTNKMPEIKLKKEIKQRQKEIIRYLPDAVDLLSICVQAGLGLDSAFQKVSEEFTLTSPIVSNEFARLNKDILSGLNREDAYKNLVLRNDNHDLHSFVALLVQSDKLGTSVSQSLGAFCDSMRTKKRQRVEELSQQASTKMTVPMVLFMLPSIFIIIMYPAIQKIMTNLGH